jgi:hypothetical protein
MDREKKLQKLRLFIRSRQHFMHAYSCHVKFYCFNTLVRMGLYWNRVKFDVEGMSLNELSK